MPFVVGITGGIGSGKSTVARVFECLKVPVYNADLRARELTNDPETLKSIHSEFGNSVFTGAVLNRKELAALVFKDEEKLVKLNKIIHPLVKEDFDSWVNKSQFPYVIKEAAIMIESGSYKQLQELIVVSAPRDMRIERVMLRDGISREEVINRMDNQISEAERLKYADTLFVNDNKELLIPQIVQYHYKLLDKLNV